MLTITDQICRMGKYSNNLEKHGEEDVPTWAVPFTAVMLSTEQINTLFADPHADRALFNTNKQNLKEPMPWLSKCSLDYADKFEGATVTMTLSGDRELEFSGCPVKVLSLQPRVGGLTESELQVQVHPDRKQLVLIHEHQNREVKLSISDAKVALKKKSTQQELALVSDVTAPNGSHLPGAKGTDGAAEAKSTDDAKAFEDGAKAQVAAFKSKPGTVADGRSERVKHQDREREGRH